MPTKTRLVTNHVKVRKNADGNLVFRVLGNPFFGPDELNGKDFDGEYFSPETDFGDEIGIKTIYATLDHAIAIDNTGKRYIHPMQMFVGKAEYVETDELGRWYDIEVSRGEKYQQMLLDLHGKGLLRASAQAIPSSVIKHKPTGHIESWVNAEIAFTTHAANPNAVVEVMKNFEIDDFNGEAFLKVAEVTERELRDSFELVLPVSEKTEETGEESEEQSLSDFVKETLNADSSVNEEDESNSEDGLDSTNTPADANGAKNTTEDVTEVTKISSQLAEISQELKRLYQTFQVIFSLDGYVEDGPEDGMVSIAEQISQIFKSQQTMLSKTQNIESGLKTFTTEIARTLNEEAHRRAKVMTKMSKEEREAEDVKVKTRTYVTQVPDDAPGSY